MQYVVSSGKVRQQSLTLLLVLPYSKLRFGVVDACVMSLVTR